MCCVYDKVNTSKFDFEYTKLKLIYMDIKYEKTDKLQTQRNS